MRIFTAVRHSLNPSYFYGGLWSGNFYPALQKLGQEVVESQVDLLQASRFMEISSNFTSQEQEIRAQITQKIIDEVRQAHQQKPIDLFLSYFYNSHFDPQGFEEIHKLGIPTVNFYCNSIYQFELVAEIATKVNVSWHTEKDAGLKYKTVGANPVWVQLGANPEIYHPIPNIISQPKACFVGQRYADRDHFLAFLLMQNLPVDVYGSGWLSKQVENSQENLQWEKNNYLGRINPKPGSFDAYSQVVIDNFKREGLIGGVVRTVKQWHHRKITANLLPVIQSAYKGYAASLSETFASYQIILNFSNVWADGRSGSRLIPHVRMRDFEAPMSGCCYLTGYTEEITDCYKIGKEIDTYKSADELADKLKFYLEHPEISNVLKIQGYQRSLRDHTWTNRFRKLFHILNIIK